MLTIIITAYGEPTATKRAVDAVLHQKLPRDYKVIVADPTIEGAQFILNTYHNNKHVEYFEDPDLGKSHALNLILKQHYSKNTKDILIFTDGDVCLKPNAIKEILTSFSDEKVGVVCGHPVPLNERNTLFGYWTHLAFDEMNNTRKKCAAQKEFFEVSGYLFAIRNGIIQSFPTEASEDNIIPMLFWEKGYTIQYAEHAEVAVISPQKLSEWIAQKKRNIKGHIALPKMNIPRRKNTVLGEAVRGLKVLFTHPRNPKEFLWAICMAFARLYVWVLAYCEAKIVRKRYKDGWREEENLTTTRSGDEEKV